MQKRLYSWPYSLYLNTLTPTRVKVLTMERTDRRCENSYEAIQLKATLETRLSIKKELAFRHPSNLIYLASGIFLDGIQIE